MNKPYRLIVSFLIALVVIGSTFISCSEETDCSMTARPYAVCKFYTYGANKDIVKKDTIPNLTVTALGTDSILLNRDEKVHTWNQPLHYTEPTTTFVLIYGDPSVATTPKDTIWLKHENSSFFVSIECGFQTRQTITEVVNFTKHKIDKVSITNQEANNNGRENIKIIF